MKVSIKSIVKKIIISIPAVLAVVVSLLLCIYAFSDSVKGVLAVPLIIAIIASVLSFYVVLIYKSKERAIRNELKSLQNEMMIFREYYEYIDTKIEDINKLRHEFRNYLSIIKYDDIGEDTAFGITQNLEKKAKQIINEYYCDNKLINIIINKKAEEAKASNIDFFCKAFIPNDVSIDTYDLCSCVFNLLDNAMIANSKAGAEENRFIEFKAGIMSGYLIIKQRNSVFENQNIDSNGDFLTSQQGEGHGFGLKIIKDICDKYNGYCEFEQKGGEFHSTLGLLVEKSPQ